MKDINTHVSVQGFYTTHLSGLIEYAITDTEFAESFAHHIRTMWNEPTLHTVVSTTPTSYTAPKKRADAVRIAAWLIATLPEQTTTDARAARTLAYAWAANHESPKNVVLGIVGVAIIGPTLGLIKSKKKKKSAMRLVTHNEHFNKLTKKQLTSFVAEATGQQLATELRYASGDAMKLHPDTFDWIMSDHKNELFTDTREGLQETIVALTSEHLPHTIIRNRDEVVAVAISPSVHEEFIKNTNAAAV